MITVTIEQKRGAFTRRVRVTAPSIERALQISGSEASADEANATQARVVFPIDGEAFFAPPAASEGIDFGRPSNDDPPPAHDASIKSFENDPGKASGSDGMDLYAFEPSLPGGLPRGL